MALLFLHCVGCKQCWCWAIQYGCWMPYTFEQSWTCWLTSCDTYCHVSPAVLERATLQWLPYNILQYWLGWKTSHLSWERDRLRYWKSNSWIHLQVSERVLIRNCIMPFEIIWRHCSSMTAALKNWNLWYIQEIFLLIIFLVVINFLGTNIFVLHSIDQLFLPHK